MASLQSFLDTARFGQVSLFLFRSILFQYHVNIAVFGLLKNDMAAHYGQKLLYLRKCLRHYEYLYPVTCRYIGVSKAQPYADNCLSAVLSAINYKGDLITLFHPGLLLASGQKENGREKYKY